MAKIAIRADILEKMRKEKSLSNQALAAIIGIDKTMLWRIKTGRSSPGQEFIAKFLTAFPNMKFEDIFFLDIDWHGCHSRSAPPE